MSLDEPVAARELTAPGPTPSAWTQIADDPLIAMQAAWPTLAAVGQRLFAFGGDGGALLLMSDDGMNWTDYPTGVPARRYPSGVLFQDKLFLVGGEGANDTWATSNFKDWSRLSASAGWGARYGHALVPFNGRLFLAGGVASRPFGDVWSTADGVSWTQMNANAFTPRLFAAGGSVGGRMVLLGGNQDAGPIAETLASTDGITWTSHPAPWPARWGARTVSVGDTLFLIGGESAHGSLTDVWATRDAINWVQVDNGAPQLSQFAAGLFGDRMVVLGGRSGGQPNPRAWAYRPRPLGWSKIGVSALTANQNQPAVATLRGKVWSMCGDQRNNLIVSADGIQWTSAPGSLPYEQFRSATEQADALWVSGGRNANQDSTNDVWTSGDGVTWMQTTPRAQWAGRNGHAMASFNGRLWVMAGRHEGRYFPDVWSSADGAQWRLENGAAFNTLFAASAVVFANRLWLLGGSRVGTQVSSSADGVTWQDHGAPFPWRLFPHAHVIGDAIYLLGGFTGATNVFTEVWASRDGLNWTQLEGAGPWKAGADFGSAVIDGSIVVFGGKDSARQFSPDIYRYTPPPF